MVNNGSLHYDHDRDGTHTELAGCVSAFRKIERETYVAIRYEMNKLTVMIFEIDSCFLLSMKIATCVLCTKGRYLLLHFHS